MKAQKGLMSLLGEICLFCMQDLAKSLHMTCFDIKFVFLRFFSLTEFLALFFS